MLQTQLLSSSEFSWPHLASCNPQPSPTTHPSCPACLCESDVAQKGTRDDAHPDFCEVRLLKHPGPARSSCIVKVWCPTLRWVDATLYANVAVKTCASERDTSTTRAGRVSKDGCCMRALPSLKRLRQVKSSKSLKVCKCGQLVRYLSG